MTEKQHRINIRIDQETYNLLKTQSARRGESMSQIARRMLAGNLQSESALDSQDALITAVRKAISQELRRTENRLANLASKTAITSASTENLVSRALVLLNEPDVSGIRTACRKRGVAFVREPLEQIMQAYEEEVQN